MPSPNPIHERLHGQELSTLSAHEKVLTLKDDQNVENAVDLFEAESIHSAPVLSKDGEVLGYVDMLDVVWSMIKVAPSAESLSTVSRDELAALKMFGRAIAWEELGKVANASGREPLEQLFEKDPATRAAELMGKGNLRVPIFDNDGAVINTVSQSAVLAAVRKDIETGKVGEMSALSIKELGLLGNAENKVVTINKSENVLKAVHSLQDAGVHAIAVVDDAGKLVGNFSATDLQKLVKSKLPQLLDSIEAYLTENSAASLKPVTVDQAGDSSFKDLVCHLVDSHISRVWVVADGKPVDVISGTDVCRLISTRTYP